MNNLSKRISARCSDNEYLEFTKKCEIANMSMAEFTRKMIFSSTVKQNDKEYQKKILWLMSNITSNINQIAHHSNIEKALDQKILNELLEISNFVNSLVKS
ncbi:MAG: hypothetical protein Q7S59_06450 [Sulfurimonas sp.]|nr:hypothetical protein [Sulfurimonas sp.]